METKRKKVFICSPYRGDVEGNIKKAAAYCRMACEKGYMPIAPHLFIPQFLDDDVETERALGISMGLDLLLLCEEMWVFGNPTEGKTAEISFAIKHGIKIIYMDDEKTMTIKQAQEIVDKQGFAWTVTEIMETEQFIGIICEWRGNISHMIYSKVAEIIVEIGGGLPW